MRAFALETVADERRVQLLVLVPRRTAFVFVDGAPVGRSSVDPEVGAVTLERATEARVAAAGLDAARLTAVLRDALHVEGRARRTLEAASNVGSDDREAARALMRASALEHETLAATATGQDRDLALRIRARIEELALRFA